MSPASVVGRLLVERRVDIVHFGAGLAVVADGSGGQILAKVAHPAVEIQVDNDLVDDLLIPVNRRRIAEVDDGGAACCRLISRRVNRMKGNQIVIAVPILYKEVAAAPGL